MTTILILLLSLIFPAQSAQATTLNQALGWTVTQDGPQGAYLVLSDIHFDPFVDRSLVHELAAAPAEQWDAILAKSTLGAFPTYADDTNWPLWQSALAALDQPGVHYDYVLILGDFLAHKFMDKYKASFDWKADDYNAFILKTERYIQLSLAKALPGIPVYCALGNNDADCGDYALQPKGPFLAGLTTVWPSLIADPDAAKDFKEAGFYETRLPDKAGSLIVLNNDYWSRHNPNSCSDAPNDEGQRQLDWLGAHLDADAKAGRSVTLAMHIPAGVNAFGKSCGLPVESFLRPEFQAPFIALLTKHAGHLRLAFASHTHFDDDKVLSDGKGNTLAFHLAPSIGPNHGNNPSFQIGLYQRADGALTDLATYTLNNLTSSARGGTDPEWGFEYGFQKSYGQPFNTQGIAAVVRAIHDGEPARSLYEAFFTGRTESKSKVGPDQWKPFNCAQTAFTPEEFSACACP